MARVLIVGGGLSGLTAAMVLKQKEPNLGVLVLEARERIGGRMCRQEVNTDSGPAWIDLGGQWVGTAQTRIGDLSKDLGIEPFQQWKDGFTTIRYGDGVYLDDKEPPAPGDPDRAATRELLGKLKAEAEKVVPDTAKPWATNDAGPADRRTLGQWIDASSASAYARFYAGLDATFNQSGGSPDEVSLLHALFERRANPPEDKPDEYLYVGGAGQIPGLMVKKYGITVRCSARVVSISQAAGKAKVTIAGQENAEEADAVIVAMPPSLTTEIHYDPPLPARRLQLCSRMAMGTIAKIALVYDKPWWRERNLSGAAIGDKMMTVAVTADSGPLGDNVPGVLTSFIQGDKLIKWSEISDDLARRYKVLDDLEVYFGGAVRAHKFKYVETIWPREQFTGGAYNGYLPPGGWTSYGEAIRQPFQRIFWAGTETATEWFGYFDGAVRAGRRAADEALKDIG